MKEEVEEFVAACLVRSVQQSGWCLLRLWPLNPLPIRQISKMVNVIPPVSVTVTDVFHVVGLSIFTRSDPIYETPTSNPVILNHFRLVTLFWHTVTLFEIQATLYWVLVQRLKSTTSIQWSNWVLQPGFQIHECFTSSSICWPYDWTVTVPGGSTPHYHQDTWVVPWSSDVDRVCRAKGFWKTFKIWFLHTQIKGAVQMTSSVLLPQESQASPLHIWQMRIYFLFKTSGNGLTFCPFMKTIFQIQKSYFCNVTWEKKTCLDRRVIK